MTMFSHTPGPWRSVTGRDPSQHALVIKEGPPARTLAIIPPPPRATGTLAERNAAWYETEYNARLIAAAPTMLDALRCAWHDLRNANAPIDAVARIEAAIHLATPFDKE